MSGLSSGIIQPLLSMILLLNQLTKVRNPRNTESEVKSCGTMVTNFSSAHVCDHLHSALAIIARQFGMNPRRLVML